MIWLDSLITDVSLFEVPDIILCLGEGVHIGGGRQLLLVGSGCHVQGVFFDGRQSLVQVETLQGAGGGQTGDELVAVDVVDLLFGAVVDA